MFQENTKMFPILFKIMKNLKMKLKQKKTAATSDELPSSLLDTGASFRGHIVRAQRPLSSRVRRAYSKVQGYSSNVLIALSHKD